MTRTLRTLLLSVTALGALATAASAATPTHLPGDADTAGMTGMHARHATGMPLMHAGVEDVTMTAMHTAMTTDPAAHDAVHGDVDHDLRGHRGMGW